VADEPLQSLLRRVRRATGRPEEGGVSDADLLGQFLSLGDEAAFELIVRRHERMVWGVCRRVAGDHHDAEDVFQATFLVLAKKARSVANRASLAAWLHQVAYRAALRARARARRALHLPQPEPGADHAPFAALEWRELRPLLDQALGQLPEKQRAAVVLCYLEGKTYAEAAQELGCPKGTLSIRLTRARQRLQHLLERLGVGGPAGVLSAVLDEPASATAPPARCAALAVKAATGAAPPRVAALTQGVLRAMLLTRLKNAAALLLALGLVVAGGTVLTCQALAPKATAQRPQTASAARAPTDAADAPLPAGVLTRLGSTRLRHGDRVVDLAFLPDGKTLAAADKGSIRLWDTATGREVRRFGDGTLKSMSLSADGKRLASSPEHFGPFRVWDVRTGRLVRTIDGPNWSTVVLSPDGKRLAAISANAQRSGLGSAVHLWDVDTGQKLHHLDKHTDIAWSLAFSPDGKRLYSGGADCTIRVWDVASGREQGRIEKHHGKVCHLTVSPDGKWLASIGMHYDKYHVSWRSWDTYNRVSLWSTATLDKVRDLVGPGVANNQNGFPSEGFAAVAFTPDSKTVVTTGVQNVVRLWDVATGKERQKFRLPGTMPCTVAVSPDGSKLAVGDNVLHLLDIKTGRDLLPQPGHQARLTAVASSGDGRTFATAGGDRTIRLWDRSTGREVRRIDCDTAALCLGFISGGRQLVSSGGDRHTRVWEVATGREVRRFPGVACDPGTGWALSPDGKTVAQALLWHKRVSLWDTRTGKERPTQPEREEWGVMGLGFSADSRTLLVCNGLNNVHLYTTATGKHLRGFKTLLRKNNYSYRDVVFSPDGRWMTLWSYREQPPTYHLRVHLFDTATGKEVRHFEDLGRPDAFSPDSRLLACQDRDERQINLVEVATGKRVHRLSGHEGPVRAVAFAADGRAVVTAGADAVALVWDLTGVAGKVVRLSPRQREQRWAELAGEDAAQAYRAGWALLATPQGAAFVQKRLHPAATVAAEQVARWIRELDDDRFEVRSAATKALEELGGRAEAALRQALKANPALEPRRRMERLLKSIDNQVLSAQQLRWLRTIAVLEGAGTPEARRLLAELAGGAAGAMRTRQAKAAVDRLATRR
jgi:RNA polymerase sigma factor (sigma-70 family)